MPNLKKTWWIIGGIFAALLLAVIIVYIIGLCRRYNNAKKIGRMTTKQLLSLRNNLHEGIFGLFE